MGLEDHKLNAVLHCNRSACYQGMRKYMEAIMDASRALQLDAGYLRAFQRRADAYLAIGEVLGLGSEGERRTGRPVL